MEQVTIRDTLEKEYFFRRWFNIKPPDAVENITIREDSYIQVRSKNIVEPSYLFIPEKSVRHPHFSYICHCEVLDLIL